MAYAEDQSVEIRINTADLQPTAVRRQIMTFFSRRASDRSDFAAAELIVGELLANAIRHAPGPVRIRANWRGGEAHFTLQDSGRGFALATPVVLGTQETGRGLRLVQALARSLTVRHSPDGGNAVKVILPLDLEAAQQT